MRRQALEYAARGWPVFPCIGKRPAIRAGFYSATTDPYVIGCDGKHGQSGWWRSRFRTANIATPTGQMFAVLDIDGPDGVDALRHVGVTFTSPGPIAKTPRGWHYYFQPIGTTHTGIVKKVDWKDAGGYVILPPSRSSTGVKYYWIDGHGPDRPIPPLPDELQAIIEPPPPIPPTMVRNITHVDRYIDRAIEDEAATVRFTFEGERNHQLNVSTFKLGRFAADGACDPILIVAAMYDAANRAGLGYNETKATIQSALSKHIGGADAQHAVHAVMP